MKTKHTIWINNEVFTRVSDRVYTHAVVGQTDEARQYKYAITRTEQDRDNAKYFAERVVDASDPSSQKSAIGYGYTTDVEGNIEKIVAERLKWYQAEKKADAFRPLVLSWHQGLRNAEKALAAKHACYNNLRIVEVGTKHNI